VPDGIGDGEAGVQRKATGDVEGGFQNIGFIEDGDWFAFSPLSLANIESISFRAASESAGGTIEVRTGAPNGPIVSSVDVPNTGGWQTYNTYTATLSDPPAGRQHQHRRAAERQLARLHRRRSSRTGGAIGAFQGDAMRQLYSRFRAALAQGGVDRGSLADPALTWFFAALTVVLLFAAVMLIADAIAIHRDNVPATAKVTAVERSHGRTGGYNTDVTFEAGGRKVRGPVHLKERISVGATIEIRYARDDPTVFEASGSNNQLWGAVVVSGAALATMATTWFRWRSDRAA
jgi:hypothetical protein